MFSNTIFGGEQPNWLIAFYGYGQSANVYKPLYELVKNTHNVLVIDIPMRDYTDDYFPEDLDAYLATLFTNLKIDKFQSVSYSMGSRMNLYLPLFFPKRLKQIFLIAPDGIKVQFLNRIGVDTYFGNKLFQYFVKKEGFYVGLLTFLYKIKLLDKSLYAFSKWNMRDVKQRTHVYNAWMNLRKFIPNNKKVNEVIEEHKIVLQSYFGKDDVVIAKRFYRQCAKLFPTGQHTLLETDHNILKQNFFIQLAKEIQK